MRRIDICYTACNPGTQTVAPTIPGFQGIRHCIQYMTSHPNTAMFHPSNSHDGSNVIRLTWSGNQVEEYTTQNFLEYHQDANHPIILNRRRSVSGIINNLLGVAVCCKVYIQIFVASDSTDG